MTAYPLVSDLDEQEDQRNRAAAHEAGHLVAGWALGRVLGGAALADGVWAGRGCAMTVPQRVAGHTLDRLDVASPLCCWPAEIRAWLEGQCIVLMAGEAAELAVRVPVTRRSLAPVAERVVADAPSLPAVVADDPVSAEVFVRLTEALTAPEPRSDDELIAEAARAAHGSDIRAASLWLGHLEHQARRLVTRYAPSVERIAVELAAVGQLSGRQAAELLEAAC